MPLRKPKAVNAACYWQYTADGEEVQVLGVVFTRDGRWNKQNDARINDANAVLCEFHCSLVNKTGIFKHRKTFRFQTGLYSVPHQRL